MSHANAFLTPKGRAKLQESIVDHGWSIRRAAERSRVSPTTAKKWADRYRTGGQAAMADRSGWGFLFRGGTVRTSEPPTERSG